MAITKIRVRVQAHGGKYLGPAVATTPPQLTVLIGGTPVGPSQTFPTASSGTVVQDYVVGASPHTIIVESEPKKTPYYPTPGTYWLVAPDEGEADLIVSLDLEEPTAVEFRVTAFASNDESQPVFGSVTLTLAPGVDYTRLQPGLVVPVHGLRVFAVSAAYDSSTGLVNVQATVEMMCGCPITLQPRTQPIPKGVEAYWPSNEFEVTAYFFRRAVVVGSVTLSCTYTTSLFSGSAAMPAGTNLVVVSAIQPGMMNAGSGATNVSLG
jgi:hypothetical protein